MSSKTQTTGHIRRKLPRNPYIKLHKRLVDFSNNAELDPELMLRNEYLRLENMILRGMYFEERERLKFSEEEKIEMASAMSRVRGRSRHKASLLSPAQVIRYSRQSAGKKYVTLFPKKTPNPRIPLKYKEDILRSIINDHPSWNK